MRAILPLILLGHWLLAGAAAADNVNLFALRKPVNPENLVQTFVTVAPSCQIGNIDFYWMMNGTSPKTPNGILRCNILKRIRSVRAPGSDNKAACPQELPPGAACFQKFYMVDEIAKTGQSFPLVIRSVKSASSGKCSVAAFVDLDRKSTRLNSSH